MNLGHIFGKFLKCTKISKLSKLYEHHEKEMKDKEKTTNEHESVDKTKFTGTFYPCKFRFILFGHSVKELLESWLKADYWNLVYLYILKLPEYVFAVFKRFCMCVCTSF